MSRLQDRKEVLQHPMVDGIYHRNFPRLWLCAIGSLLVHSGLLWLGISLRAARPRLDTATASPLAVQLVDPLPVNAAPPLPRPFPSSSSSVPIDTAAPSEGPPARPPSPITAAPESRPQGIEANAQAASPGSVPLALPEQTVEAPTFPDLPTLEPDETVAPPSLNPPQKTPPEPQPSEAPESPVSESSIPESSAPNQASDPEAIAEQTPQRSPDAPTDAPTDASLDLPTVAVPEQPSEPKSYLASLTVNPAAPSEESGLDQLPYPPETQRVFEADPLTSACLPTPESARRLGETVSVRVMVEPDGRVIPWATLDPTSLDDASGPSPLTSEDQAYEQLAACVLEEQWTFEPAISGGVPVPSDQLIVSIQLSALDPQ